MRTRSILRAVAVGGIAAALMAVTAAPTILGLLGLDPGALQAVRIQHTGVLPALGGGSGH